MNPVGKSFKLNLLVLSMRRENSSATSGDFFYAGDIVTIIGCVTMGYSCFTTDLTTTGCSSKGTYQSHTRVVGLFTSP
jgi:hypothetical protein